MHRPRATQLQVTRSSTPTARTSHERPTLHYLCDGMCFDDRFFCLRKTQREPPCAIQAKSGFSTQYPANNHGGMGVRTVYSIVTTTNIARNQKQGTEKKLSDPRPQTRARPKCRTPRRNTPYGPLVIDFNVTRRPSTPRPRPYPAPNQHFLGARGGGVAVARAAFAACVRRVLWFVAFFKAGGRKDQASANQIRPTTCNIFFCRTVLGFGES